MNVTFQKHKTPYNSYITLYTPQINTSTMGHTQVFKQSTYYKELKNKVSNSETTFTQFFNFF